jgi:hypothetical protein
VIRITKGLSAELVEIGDPKTSRRARQAEQLDGKFYTQTGVLIANDGGHDDL